MDVVDRAEDKILHALTLLKEEYSDDYSDETYSYLLDEVLSLGLELFGERWFKDIVDARIKYLLKD